MRERTVRDFVLYRQAHPVLHTWHIMSHKATTGTYFYIVSYIPTNQKTSGFLSKPAADGFIWYREWEERTYSCNRSVKNIVLFEPI